MCQNFLRPPLAPFHIAREAFEKLHVDLRRSLGKNLKSCRSGAVYAAPGLFDQTSSLQEYIRPCRSVTKSSLPTTWQHLVQVFFAEIRFQQRDSGALRPISRRQRFPLTREASTIGSQVQYCCLR